MEYDKVNKEVGFLEGPHKYINLKDPTIQYISVTTLIERFGQPFDKEFTSKYKALERLLPSDIWKKEKGALWKNKKIPKDFLEVYDISENDLNRVQQDILDEWEQTNREACERGTKIHAEIENSFYAGRGQSTLQKLGVGGKFECKKDYFELDLEYGVYPEYLIYWDSADGIVHLAGQIDLLIKDGNNIIIGDWKTNKEIKTKGFFNNSTRTSTKMKYPLNNLEECNFSHYQLQLSTYAWMLQKINPEFIIKDLILSHFDHNGKNTLYHCKYLKDEVEKMLKFHKKQLILEKQKQKYARVEY